LVKIFDSEPIAFEIFSLQQNIAIILTLYEK